MIPRTPDDYSFLSVIYTFADCRYGTSLGVEEISRGEFEYCRVVEDYELTSSVSCGNADVYSIYTYTTNFVRV